MPFDLAPLAPLEDGVRGQFGAVIADDDAGIVSGFGDEIQFPGDTDARDRVVDYGRQALPAEVIDDTKNPEPAAIRQTVGDEVQGPSLVRLLRDRHRHSGAQYSLAAAALAHRQALLLVEPVDLLAVLLNALALQQDMQAPIAKAAAFRCQLT